MVPFLPSPPHFALGRERSSQGHDYYQDPISAAPLHGAYGILIIYTYATSRASWDTLFATENICYQRTVPQLHTMYRFAFSMERGYGSHQSRSSATYNENEKLHTTVNRYISDAKQYQLAPNTCTIMRY